MIRGKPFEKGHIGYKGMLGKKHSLEARKKISEAISGEKNPNYGKSTWIKGRHHTEKTKRKMGEARRGKKHTKETREKISLANKGNSNVLGKHWKLSEKTKENMKGRTGVYKRTEEMRRKISDGHRGEKNYRWMVDRTKLSRVNKQGERRTSAYLEWRKQVWLRDNFQCKINNEDCNGRIEAHHILNWNTYPELRYEVNNGITLCHAHHPRKRAEEKFLIPMFQGLIKVLGG